MKERKRFLPRQRLRSADVAALLAEGRLLRLSGFTVLLKGNALGIPRLNVVVPKRVVPRAVDRNRMKRVLREWFRRHQRDLGGRDVSIRITGKSPVIAELAGILMQS